MASVCAAKSCALSIVTCSEHSPMEQSRNWPVGGEELIVGSLKFVAASDCKRPVK